MKTYLSFPFWVLAAALLPGLSAQALDVTLAWDAPMYSETDQPLQDICGYELCYGNEPGIFTHSVRVEGQSSVTVTGLTKGVTYFFAVKACTGCGNESSFSEGMVWTAPVLADTDGDFLDDDWEMAVFERLDATEGDDRDSDFDGATDYEEFVAGTHPNDPASAPLLALTSESGQRVVVFFARAASGQGYENRNRYYTLAACVDLKSGLWEPVPGATDIPGDNQQVVHTIDPASQAFYKALIRLD